MKQAIFLFVICFLLVVSVIVNFILHTRLAEKTSEAVSVEHNIKKIVEINSQTMSELGFTFKNLIANSSVMMRYNHYLDEHDPSTKVVLFCPECTGGKDDLPPLEEPSLVPLPSTLEQLKKDINEIRISVTTIRNSLHNQGFKLRYTLGRLKEDKWVPHQ